MRMIKLNCPNCNAALEAEDNLDMFYCKYCGAKIVLSGMSKEAYKSRVRMKQMEHDERMKDKDHEQERYRYEYVANENQRERKNKLLTATLPVMFPVIMMLIIFSVLGIIALQITLEQRHADSKIAKTEMELDTLIQDGDYENALFKANQLRYDSGISSDREKQWDEKRENYIELINKYMKEDDLKDPDNIFVSSDYKSFQGRNLDEVKTEFEKMGFTNISAQPASKKAGWLDKAESVEHILIGGKSEFTEEDYFRKDTPIIIYYYEK